MGIEYQERGVVNPLPNEWLAPYTKPLIELQAIQIIDTKAFATGLQVQALTVSESLRL